MHKVRKYKTDRYPLVELYRKGDLVEFSLDIFKFGIPSAYVSDVKKTIPNNDFHWFLMKSAREWFAKHPFSPPLFMKWSRITWRSSGTDQKQRFYPVPYDRTAGQL